MQSIKINCSKIDKDALYQGKNGKYLDLVLFENKAGPDQYGNDGFVVQELPQSRREAGEKGPILGNWKHIKRKEQAQERPKHSAESTYQRPKNTPQQATGDLGVNPATGEEYPF